MKGLGVPGFFFFKESFKEGMIESMARFSGDDVAQNRHAEQGEITDTVQQFVAHKLVLVSQPIIV